MFTLDTNILIYYAAGDKGVAHFLYENRDEVFYLPTIVISEFLSHPSVDDFTEMNFRAFVYQTNVVNFDVHLAELSARLRRLYKLKLGDAAIAATAISTHSSLITRNIRDFKNIKELEVIKL